MHRDDWIDSREMARNHIRGAWQRDLFKGTVYSPCEIRGWLHVYGQRCNSYAQFKSESGPLVERYIQLHSEALRDYLLEEAIDFFRINSV